MLVSVFDFQDYREFLNAWIESQGARGIKGRLAQAANVSSTLISLVLKGDKHLTLEQAVEIGEFLGMSEQETDYFFLLVELGRAGTVKLRQKLKKKIREQQEESKKLAKRLRKDAELSEEQKATFYSSWLYSGTRILSALETHHDISSIAARLEVPPAVISRVLTFLVEAGLCKFEDGKLTYGPSYTHVAADSPYVIKHHQNWRVQGFRKMDLNDDRNLFYTCPMALSPEAAAQIRALLPKVIDEVLAIFKPSPSEEVYCFNIDWFSW
jgi:uncharacterized protein (TIGR02147 family)